MARLKTCPDEKKETADPALGLPAAGKLGMTSFCKV
jgi:hypothetical protein